MWSRERFAREAKEYNDNSRKKIKAHQAGGKRLKKKKKKKSRAFTRRTETEKPIYGSLLDVTAHEARVSVLVHPCEFVIVLEKDLSALRALCYKLSAFYRCLKSVHWFFPASIIIFIIYVSLLARVHPHANETSMLLIICWRRPCLRWLKIKIISWFCPLNESCINYKVYTHCCRVDSCCFWG